jgi:hypothetical protein
MKLFIKQEMFTRNEFKAACLVIMELYSVIDKSNNKLMIDAYNEDLKSEDRGKIISGYSR